MAEYIELIDKYQIVQSKDTDYNPPSYEWVDNTGEIVRCKDCKHWQRGTIDENDNFYAPQCKLLLMPISSSDFCSHAKKRIERL